MKRKDWIIGIIAGLALGFLALVSGTAQRVFARPTIASADTQIAQIRTLMLGSHTTWHTIMGEAITVWHTKTGTETWTTTFQIEQPRYAFLEVAKSEKDGVSMSWLSSSQGIYMTNFSKGVYTAWPVDTLRGFDIELSILPVNLSKLEPETVYRHPLGGRMPTVLGDYLYPTGLAQRSVGEYTLLGIDTLLGRSTYIIAWALRDAAGKLSQIPTAKYWVDAQTGVILKAVIYTSEDLSQIMEETTVTSIAFDASIPSENFVFDSADLLQITPEEFLYGEK